MKLLAFLAVTCVVAYALPRDELASEWDLYKVISTIYILVVYDKY